MRPVRWSLRFIILLVLLNTLALARKARPKVNMKELGRRKGVETRSAGYLGWVLAIAIGSVFIPQIIYFIYSIVRDPDAPGLIKKFID